MTTYKDLWKALSDVYFFWILISVWGFLCAVVMWWATDLAVEFRDIWMGFCLALLAEFLLCLVIGALWLLVYSAVEYHADTNKKYFDELSSGISELRCDVRGLRSGISVSITYKYDSEEEVCRNKDTSTSVGANT